MGRIAAFLNLAVYMYTEPDSPHHKPHCHVIHGENKAVISIPEGEVLAKSRNFPIRELRAVQTWVFLRAGELQADWELAVQGKQPLPIKPLI